MAKGGSEGKVDTVSCLLKISVHDFISTTVHHHDNRTPLFFRFIADTWLTQSPCLQSVCFFRKGASLC